MLDKTANDFTIQARITGGGTAPMQNWRLPNETDPLSDVLRLARASQALGDIESVEEAPTRRSLRHPGGAGPARRDGFGL